MYTNGYNMFIINTEPATQKNVNLALEWAESVKKAVIIRQNIFAQIYRK
jgi:hypothetical protein